MITERIGDHWLSPIIILQKKNEETSQYFWLAKGPVALGDKNFVSSAEFQEKVWLNKFLFQNFC